MFGFFKKNNEAKVYGNHEIKEEQEIMETETAAAFAVTDFGVRDRKSTRLNSSH